MLLSDGSLLQFLPVKRIIGMLRPNGFRLKKSVLVVESRLWGVGYFRLLIMGYFWIEGLALWKERRDIPDDPMKGASNKCLAAYLAKHLLETLFFSELKLKYIIKSFITSTKKA